LRAGHPCPGLPGAAARRRARRASPGRGAGPDPRRRHPAGHRLVLPAGHPGQRPGRRRPRGDVPEVGDPGVLAVHQPEDAEPGRVVPQFGVSPARRTARMSRAAKSAGVALPRRRSRNPMRRTPRRGRCGGRA
jgi:hypothetical protein